MSPILAILLAVSFFLYLALALVLVRKYLRTRDVGFLWLGMAVIVWPRLETVIGIAERTLIERTTRHEFVLFPFSLVERGRMTMGSLVVSLSNVHYLIGLALLLIAAACLCKRTARHPSLT